MKYYNNRGKDRDAYQIPYEPPARCLIGSSRFHCLVEQREPLLHNVSPTREPLIEKNARADEHDRPEQHGENWSDVPFQGVRKALEASTPTISKPVTNHINQYLRCGLSFMGRTILARQRFSQFPKIPRLMLCQTGGRAADKTFSQVHGPRCEGRLSIGALRLSIAFTTRCHI